MKFLSIFFGLILTVSVSANSDVNNFLESGKLSEVAGEYSEAITWYKKAIEVDSNSYEAHLYLGGVYHTQSNYVSALMELNKAIKINANRDEAYYYRGNVQIDLGSVFAAVNDYSIAIEKNPNDMQYFMSRGFAFANMGDFYNAVNDYSIAIQINPVEAQSYYNMAKSQGVLNNTMMACSKITELKNEGYVRAEVVFLNFCLN